MTVQLFWLLKGQALDFAGSALHAIGISCEAMWNPFSNDSESFCGFLQAPSTPDVRSGRASIACACRKARHPDSLRKNEEEWPQFRNASFDLNRDFWKIKRGGEFKKIHLQLSCSQQINLRNASSKLSFNFRFIEDARITSFQVDWNLNQDKNAKSKLQCCEILTVEHDQAAFPCFVLAQQQKHKAGSWCQCSSYHAFWSDRM